jgi:hypothetical protein
MTNSFGRRSMVASLLGATIAGAAGRASASRLSLPSGEVILTVSGKIGITNRPPDTAVFDRDMLEALGTSSFTTTTPWYDGAVTFEGVLMTRVMEAVGARGETVTALALNDYATELPVSDFARYRVLLALKRNGAYMPVRDKGPLFIVYPYDSDPDLKSRRYHSRSVWQLAQLIVN